MKILSLLVVLFSFLVVEAQVYPYAFYPEAHATSSRKMGIVDANNKKVTEPIFDEIAFFKNQPRNRYTVFYTKVENEVDGVMKASFESGIINTRGEIIPGIKAKNLKYNGNGRIAYSDDPALELYNIKTAKSIYKEEIGAEIRVNEIISGDIYYMILFDANTKKI